MHLRGEDKQEVYDNDLRIEMVSRMVAKFI
jgi:hypothetical protein